jgi:AcrR family transcriptional regulator
MLYEILREEMEQIIEPVKHLGEDAGSSPPDQLRMVIDNHVRLTLGERRTSKLLFDTGLANLSIANRKKIIEMRDTYNRIACRIIERGIKAGVFADIDVKMAVYSIASMIVRARVWYSPRGRLSIDEIIEFIFRFALHGLSG